jgi:TPR repeat protein
MDNISETTNERVHELAAGRLLQAAKQGNVKAQIDIADMLCCGNGVLQDPTAAVYWYQTAADQGNAYAQFKLAWIYEGGHFGKVQNKMLAADLYTKASDQGFADAQFSLANCYWLGVGVAQNKTTASQFYAKAACLNHVAAMYLLGECYYRGIGVQKDKTAALTWFEKAAIQGHTASQYTLGQHYACKGAKQNLKKSVQFYQQAAEQGHAQAQISLALCYMEGRGISVNMDRATYWMKAAANLGEHHAQCIIGVWCVQGSIEVNKDPVEAVQWFTKAANEGFSVAQTALGMCFKMGYGTAVNPQASASWFHKAAVQGDVDAVREIVLCYTHGFGVEKDLEKATQLRALGQHKTTLSKSK